MPSEVYELARVFEFEMKASEERSLPTRLELYRCRADPATFRFHLSQHEPGSDPGHCAAYSIWIPDLLAGFSAGSEQEAIDILLKAAQQKVLEKLNWSPQSGVHS